jgi:valyl-tRNA synthetase
VAVIKDYILKVRQIRGEMNIAPSRRIPLLLRDADDAARLLIGRNAHYLQRLAGLDTLRLLDEGEAEPVSASAMVGSTTLLVPMAGLIDAAAEMDRLSKVIARNESDIGKLRGKLGNESFVKNAKPELVAADRAKLAELGAQNEGLARQLERVRRLGGN